jgi:dihydroorotate dehydrogenase
VVSVVCLLSAQLCAAAVPVLIKLTPNITHMRPIAAVPKEAWAADVTLINTVRGLSG